MRDLMDFRLWRQYRESLKREAAKARLAQTLKRARRESRRKGSPAGHAATLLRALDRWRSRITKLLRDPRSSHPTRNQYKGDHS